MSVEIFELSACCLQVKAPPLGDLAIVWVKMLKCDLEHSVIFAIAWYIVKV